MALHHLLILTKHPDDYRARIEAAALPDLAIVASADVAEAGKVEALTTATGAEASVTAVIVPPEA